MPFKTSLKHIFILGIGYSTYENFHSHVQAVSKAMHAKHLVDKFIPMTGMWKELENGITVLDVGCAEGFHVLDLLGMCLK